MEYWMASNETGHNAREETIQEVLKHPGSAILFLGYPPWLLHFAASCCILFMLVGIPGNLFTIIALCRTKKRRFATGRKQEEVPSAFKSNCTSTVPYTNDVCLKQPTTSNQLNNSVNEEESKMQQHSSNYTQKKEREFWKNDENVLEKIDNIPYADERCDESEVMESEIFSINNKMKESFGKRGNKLERMASRASFIIESSIWVEKLESSRTNSPDRSTKKQATIIPRDSTSRSVRRWKKYDGPVKMSNKDRKLLKMILVIFSSFLICYLPITITKTFKDAIDWRGLNIASYILIYLTTCINPVVYVVMSSEYRSAYKNVLFCRNEVRNEARKSLE